MKKIPVIAFILMTISYLLSCTSTSTQFVVKKPEAGKSIIVGAILVENDGIDDLYQSKTSNITVVVVGKSVQGGQEISQGYHVKTDKNGYFAIQNVPPGAYVLKGIEVDVGFTKHYLITSRWEGNRQYYIYADQMIDYNVRTWPEATELKVIDVGINYFKLDNAGRIYYDRFKLLHNTSLGIKDKYYTMTQPRKYFQEQYPEMEWF
ncbi:hypothetical protein JW960_05580 [candidate division KSB1 bacterium]|nr:hypothetical protein [candidate division KSB1 bacterium]